MRTDATEAIANIPENRSLIVEQLSSEEPVSPQAVKGLTTIEEVFERDPNQKDRIYLDIHMTPFFPAKSFVIKLDGTKGDDGATWNTDYQQE